MNEEMILIEGILSNVMACNDGRDIESFINTYIPQEIPIIYVGNCLWKFGEIFLTKDKVRNLIEESLYQEDFRHLELIDKSFLTDMVAI